MAVRSNISNEDLRYFKFFREVDEKTNRYTVRIWTIGTIGTHDSFVGAIEKRYGKWQILGGEGKEIRDLILAIKQVINEYLDSKNEYDELITSMIINTEL